MSSTTLTMTEPLHQYLCSTGLREPSVLEELRKVTARNPFYFMQISPEQGQLMALLAKMTNARKTIDIGVFTGYSALAVALALPDDGSIIACDISEDYTRTAREFWSKAGVEDKIDLRLAPATETLQQLLDQQQANTFDMAFIDADKTGYDDYYEQCLQLVRPGGLILIDNTLWNGRVADKASNDEDTVAIRTLNSKIHQDHRVDMTMLPVSDGLTIAIKRVL